MSEDYSEDDSEDYPMLRMSRSSLVMKVRLSVHVYFTISKSMLSSSREVSALLSVW